MLRLRRLQAALALVLAGTLALGLVSGVRGSGGEVFPFASWFLFSLVPDRVTTYELRVRQFDGRTFDPPRALAAVENLAGSPRSATTFEAVQRYAQSVRDGDEARQAATWQALCARMVRFDLLRFEVVEQTFDPIERFRAGRAAERVVAADLRARAEGVPRPGSDPAP